MKKQLFYDEYKMARRTRKFISITKLHGWIIAFVTSVMQLRPVQGLWRCIFGRPIALINVMNSKMYVDLSDPGVSRQLITRGRREVEHLNDIRRHLRPGMTGIDIGANIGYFALIEAALIGPTGRLYCMEPVPENIELLHRNVKINGLTDVIHIFQNAVAAKKEILRIALTTASNSHHVLAKNNELSGLQRYMKVAGVSIDDFMDSQGLRTDDINFLRCDIEGYEVIAFKGMTKILESKSPLHLFIELHPDAYPCWGADISDVVELLVKSGFRFRRVIKEFVSPDGKEPKVEILTSPSPEEYLLRQSRWPVGGIQVYLERVGAIS